MLNTVAQSPFASPICWLNEYLRFAVPYCKNGVPVRYTPDFTAVLEVGVTLSNDAKGQYTDDAEQSAKAAERWFNVVI